MYSKQYSDLHSLNTQSDPDISGRLVGTRSGSASGEGSGSIDFTGEGHGPWDPDR